MEFKRCSHKSHITTIIICPRRPLDMWMIWIYLNATCAQSAAGLSKLVEDHRMQHFQSKDTLKPLVVSCALIFFSHYMHFALNIALSSSFPAHSLCLVFSLHFNINAAYSSAMFTFQLFFIFFKLSNLFSFNFLYPFLLFSFGLSLYFCGNALFAHFIPLQLHFWLPFFSIWSKFFLAKHWFRRRWTRALTSNQ